MSLKSEREAAALDFCRMLNQPPHCREEAQDCPVCSRTMEIIRAAEKRAIAKVERWIYSEGGYETIDSGLPIPADQLLDEEDEG